MDELIWKDPPPIRGRGRGAVYFVPRLREKPGHWALCQIYASPNSARASASRFRMRYSDCDFLSRGPDLYGRCRVPG